MLALAADGTSLRRSPVMRRDGGFNRQWFAKDKSEQKVILAYFGEC
jgi:hypothetical protein